jgi:hypothetical protein
VRDVPKWVEVGGFYLMKKTMRYVRLILVVCLLLSLGNGDVFGAGAGADVGVGLEVHAAPVARPSAMQLPPECTTKTRLDKSPIDRAWVFIVNFRVQHTGCVIVYDRALPNALIGYKSLPNACQKFGDVRVAFGKALFVDGYIACQVNIMEAVNAISGTTPITETMVTEGFYMLGRGVITPTKQLTPLHSNLVVGYDPDNPAYSNVSLRVIVTHTNPPSKTADAQMVAFFNNNIHTNDDCAIRINGPQEQMWTFTRNGGNLKMWLNSSEICAAPKPRPRIEFWQDGGTFYIGGNPHGNRFLGILEEVVVDPYDGTSPPNDADDTVEEGFVLMPSILK